MPKWVKYMSVALIIMFVVIPGIALAMLVDLWFLLLLFGLIFVPVILLQPAVEESRRG